MLRLLLSTPYLPRITGPSGAHLERLLKGARDTLQIGVRAVTETSETGEISCYVQTAPTLAFL